MGRGIDPALFPRGLPQARVTVTVSLASLLGVTRQPGQVDGVGYLPADLIRDLAFTAGSTWRRLVTDPVDGSAREVSTHRYQPPVALRRYVEARDAVCRAPGCQVPAHRCDLDHGTDWHLGQDTSAGNLSAKHRRHHNHKTRGHWRVEQHRDTGELTWRTSAGRVYRTFPHEYDDPTAPPLSHERMEELRRLIEPLGDAYDIWLHPRGRTGATRPHRPIQKPPPPGFTPDGPEPHVAPGPDARYNSDDEPPF